MGAAHPTRGLRRDGKGERVKCTICDQEMRGFQWTDTHGIGQCVMCGTPYEIYHYDADKKRVDGPPTCIVRDDYVPILREYWATFKRTIPSGCSFQGGQEMASENDQRHFYDWFSAHTPAEVAP